MEGRIGAILNTMGDLALAIAEIHQRTALMQSAMAEDMRRRYKPEDYGAVGDGGGDEAN
jgi:hypothetical protein